MATTQQSAPQEAPDVSEIFSIGKVEGTEVYRPDAERIGVIESLLVDKRTGKVAYAVLTFGGFLGIGEEFFPIPWALLRYKPELDVFELDITDERLVNAPKFTNEAAYDWSRAEGRRIDEHYGMPESP